MVGVIGVPGVGKSTIMNELYGFDATSPGMLPPFPTLSEDTRAQAKHCTSGIEPRISAQRLLLLDTQVFPCFHVGRKIPSIDYKMMCHVNMCTSYLGTQKHSLLGIF